MFTSQPPFTGLSLSSLFGFPNFNLLLQHFDLDHSFFKPSSIFIDFISIIIINCIQHQPARPFLLPLRHSLLSHYSTFSSSTTRTAPLHPPDARSAPLPPLGLLFTFLHPPPLLRSCEHGASYSHTSWSHSDHSLAGRLRPVDREAPKTVVHFPAQ